MLLCLVNAAIPTNSMTEQESYLVWVKLLNSFFSQRNHFCPKIPYHTSLSNSSIFPSISIWSFISYTAFKTLHLNKTGHLFEARHLFLIAYFKGTIDLQRSLFAMHLHGLWVLPPGDLQPRQQWPSFVLQEHFLWSNRVVVLHLTLRKTIVQWMSMRICLTNWLLDEWQIVWRKFCS